LRPDAWGRAFRGGPKKMRVTSVQHRPNAGARHATLASCDNHFRVLPVLFFGPGAGVGKLSSTLVLK
jgi:hypothetical protein